MLGADLKTYQENPLSEVAYRIIGSVGFTIFTAGAAISMLGNLSSEILSIPRILFGAASDRVLPIKAMASVHSRYGTPYVAIIIYASLGFLFASMGGFTQMAIISSTSILLVYLGVVLSVIKGRHTDPNRDQGFRIPGGYLVPSLAILVIVVIISSLSTSELLIVALTILLLSLVFVAHKKLFR